MTSHNFYKGNPLLITFVQEVLLRCWFHETSYLTKHLWQLHILTSKNTLLRTCHFFLLKKKITGLSLEDETLITPFIFLNHSYFIGFDYLMLRDTHESILSSKKVLIKTAILQRLRGFLVMKYQPFLSLEITKCFTFPL